MTGHGILLSVYRGAREIPADQFLDWALELLRTAVPFDMARWGIGIQDAGGFTFPVNHIFDDDPEIGIHYDRVRAQDTAAVWVGKHYRSTGNFNQRECYSSPDQAGTGHMPDASVTNTR
ncbi:hypothetical protein [Trinickia symbiotica]|nr:hypothetical protein [Trinickia symbiotica]